MLKTFPSQRPSINRFRLTRTLAPVTLGVALLTTVGMPVEARPVIVQPLPPTTQIYGSPIPSPMPVVPGTTQPYSISPYYSPGNSYYSPGNSYYSPGNSYYSPYNPYYSPYNNGYYNNPAVVPPGRSVIRNSTLINPTLVNPRITDSVVVDPVIIRSPRFPRGTRRPGVIYNSPGIRLRIGQ